MKNIMNKVTGIVCLIVAALSTSAQCMQKIYSLAKTIKKISHTMPVESIRTQLKDLPLGTVKPVTNKSILADITHMKDKAQVTIDHILSAAALGHHFATIVDKKALLVNPAQWHMASRYHVYGKLAHEMGHLALNHHPSMSPKKRQEQEFQADEYATIVFGAGKELVSHLLTQRKTKTEHISEYSFHPLLSERIERILKIHEAQQGKPDYLANQLWKVKFVINSTQSLPHPESQTIPNWHTNQAISGMSLEDRLKTINEINEIKSYV